MIQFIISITSAFPASAASVADKPHSAIRAAFSKEWLEQSIFLKRISPFIGKVPLHTPSFIAES
jgi:hypothetical protein